MCNLVTSEYIKLVKSLLAIISLSCNTFIVMTFVGSYYSQGYYYAYLNNLNTNFLKLLMLSIKTYLMGVGQQEDTLLER